MDAKKISLLLQNGIEEFTIPGSLHRPTVLYFMRASNCAQCNRHTRELEKLLPELESRNLDVIIVVPEDGVAADKVSRRNNLTIRVMASDGNAHALAGLDKKFIGIIQQSGTIVVDRAGTVMYKRIATNPEESFKLNEFEEYLAALSLVY